MDKGVLIPGLGGAAIIVPMKPNEWKVWPVEAPEFQAMRRSGPDPLSVVTIVIGEMMAQGMEPTPGAADDYFVRGAKGKLQRVRVMRGEAEVLTIAELRACRLCGCCEDRACSPPCSWSGPDLCSACPKEGSR